MLSLGNKNPRTSPASTEKMYRTERGACWINLMMLLCEQLHKAGSLSKTQNSKRTNGQSICELS